VKYAWIQQHRDSFPIRLMCHVLKVSKSGFYKWCVAKPSPRAQRGQRIRSAVKQVHRVASTAATRSPSSCSKASNSKVLVATRSPLRCVN
jgi:hypothetical protein